MDEIDDLTPRQQAHYQALEIIVDAFGLFDQSSGPDGAHYIPENENPFAEEGLMCANCCFYEGGQACEIVEGQIEPMALCKLWVIKADLIEEDIQKASYTPPEAVSNAAKQALKWIADGQAGDGFTATGRYRAETLAAGEAVSLDTIKRMNSYFARHEVDKQGEGWDSSSDQYPSAGRVAWAAWGGDAGWTWAKSVLNSESVEKRQFGSRSAAGSYAAQVRWGRRGGDATAPSKTISKDQVPSYVKSLVSGDGTEDLGEVQIAGTPFFAEQRGTKDREDMPQVPTARKAEFIADVESQGLTVSHESVDPATLKATQRNINGKSSAEILGRESARGDKAFSADPVGSIVVSSDGFVMDGHHRWAGAALGSTMRPTKISIIRIGAPQKELLNVMDKWGSENGIPRRGFGDQSYPVGKALVFAEACELALAAQKEFLDDNN